MGSYQSKVSPETALHEKAVLERLRSCHISSDEAGEEDGFVHVGGEKAGRDGRLARAPEGLPVELLSAWQSKVLRDPKNRCRLRSPLPRRRSPGPAREMVVCLYAAAAGLPVDSPCRPSAPPTPRPS